jgi:hypothetical protein
MDGIELLNNHSKAAVVVKQWFLERLLEGLKDDNLPEDFKKYVREQDIDNDKIGKLIDASPRALFDVFDDHKVYIDISCLNDKFLWGINDDMNNDVYKTRKDADRAAIIEAFKLLNEKL